MEQQKIHFRAPFKLNQKLETSTSEVYSWAYPDRAFKKVGRVVAILDANKEISEFLLMHYYGKLMPGIKKVPYDRVVLQKKNGHYFIVPYRPERFDFKEIDEGCMNWEDDQSDYDNDFKDDEE